MTEFEFNEILELARELAVNTYMVSISDTEEYKAIVKKIESLPELQQQYRNIPLISDSSSDDGKNTPDSEKKILAAGKPLALAINYFAMDMEGDYSESVLSFLQDLYIRRVVRAEKASTGEAEIIDHFPERSRKELMEGLLEKVASDEACFSRFSRILSNRDDEEFALLVQQLNVEGISRKDFLAWWASKEFAGNLTHGSCINSVEVCLAEMAGEGRYEEIKKLLNGNEAAFNKLKSEFPRINKNQFADYDWFLDNFIDGYYNLRYVLRDQGVEFPQENDED